MDPKLRTPQLEQNLQERSNWSWHHGIELVFCSYQKMWTSSSSFPASELVEYRSDVGLGTISALVCPWRGSWTFFLCYPALLLSNFPALGCLCWWLLRAHFRCKVALLLLSFQEALSNAQVHLFPRKLFSASPAAECTQSPALAASGLSWFAAQGWVFAPFIWNKSSQVASELCSFWKGIIKICRWAHWLLFNF